MLVGWLTQVPQPLKNANKKKANEHEKQR